jgi:hypothetical protein
MTYLKFIAELKKLGFVFPTKKRERHEIPSANIELLPPDFNQIGRWDEKDAPLSLHLLLKWESGGSRGEGNWLEGTGHSVQFVSGNPEPIWEDFDTILEHFCPEITYLKYRKLERLVKFTTMTDNGYYGDSTTYSLRALALPDLHKFLKSNKLLGNEK